jgi:hypothetical protein
MKKNQKNEDKNLIKRLNEIKCWGTKLKKNQDNDKKKRLAIKRTRIKIE